MDKKTKTKKDPSFSEEKNKEDPLKVENAQIIDDPKHGSDRNTREEDLPETKSVAKVSEFSKPLISAKDASASFQHYQELITTLMKESDVVEIQGKKKVKKTGINKIARFFGVSVEIIKTKREESVGPQGGKNFTWYVWCKAILPNGQFRVDGAACSSNERRFAHLENDVMATAITRASKRAIENLVGMGELELMETDDVDENPALTRLIMFIKTALEKAELPNDSLFKVNGGEKVAEQLTEGEASIIVADIKKGKDTFIAHIKQ